ncbi:MAG: peptidoglycan DD-metalloendopeptidase family protein [Anaerolineales bacterium]|nr:peptidoglycan DD-metalloendopeptidase family protein [Anaerolineales bacterium]
MKRLIPLIVALSLLTSCATETSLWGVQFTPTARIPAESPPATDTPIPTYTFTPEPPPASTDAPVPTDPAPTQTLARMSTPDPKDPPILYYAQSGDSLDAVAKRFGVDKSEIASPKDIPQEGLIEAGVLLIIPDRIEREKTSKSKILPDSEVVFSASASSFDVAAFIAQAGGYLSRYTQWVTTTGKTSGTDVMKRLSLENSTNPRLLLALLEYESGWVYGNPPNIFREHYPMGFQIQDDDQGLFKQLQWTINQLQAGYYGWRAGALTELVFPDGERLRLDPELNAGTVAIEYFFSRQRNRAEWERILDPDSPSSFMAYYRQMFDDPWIRAQAVEPLFPPIFFQPELTLPFEPNDQWNYTSGPHGAWDREGPLAAVDFAPASTSKGCSTSSLWILAPASGLVARAENGVVILDLDRDGDEQTGWNLLFLHVAAEGRVEAGDILQAGERIGHPSCEGGVSTGRHLHFARKYNGEWILADGAIPFVLSGWTVHNGARPYQGTLTNGARTVTADPYGQSWSVIIREP